MPELPPGPRLPKLAQAWRYTFDQPRFWAECRERYGPTWTLLLPGFPPGVVTRDRDAIRRLLTGDPLKRRHANDLLRPALGDGSLLLLEPAEHLARRKIELVPFHGDRIRSYAARIRELAAAEVETWPADGKLEVHPRSRDLTLAIILELVLGIRDPGVRRRFASDFDALNSSLTNLGLFLPDWFSARGNPAARPTYRRLDRLRGLLANHIASTRDDARLEEREDVLALLVRARDEHGTGLTDQELSDELFTLVVAGHETTATAIAWAADLLAHHPAVVERLREEPEHVKPTAKEVLRARTVAYLSAARHPLEPFPIGDWVVGPDASVLVDAQGVHLDPDVHPDPHSFRPDRFLDSAPDGYGFLPFGGGAHRCLGAALATMELEAAIEAIVAGVELAPAGPPAEPVRRGVTLAPKGGAAVLTRRRRATAPAAQPLAQV